MKSVSLREMDFDVRRSGKEDATKETQGQGVESEVETDADSDVGRSGRRYSSPSRVLIRSFRLGRDNWKMKHQAVQEKLEQERQLSADRGRSREQWKQKCETATARAG